MFDSSIISLSLAVSMNEMPMDTCVECFANIPTNDLCMYLRVVGIPDSNTGTIGLVPLTETHCMYKYIAYHSTDSYCHIAVVQ